MKFTIYLAIDVLCTWLALFLIFAFNELLFYLNVALGLDFKDIFFLGLRPLGLLILLTTAPIIFASGRLLKVESMWGYFMVSILYATLIVTTRGLLCSLAIPENHLYNALLQPEFGLREQCLYLALLNYVVIIPKALGVAILFFIIRHRIYRLFRMTA